MKRVTTIMLLASMAAASPVYAGPARSLSVAANARAGESTGEERLGGGRTLPIVLGAAAVVGLILLVTSNGSHAEPLPAPPPVSP